VTSVVAPPVLLCDPPKSTSTGHPRDQYCSDCEPVLVTMVNQYWSDR